LKTQYLYNSAEIRAKISELLSSNNEKYIFVGFVGSNPVEYLGSCVNNLTVICWPKPGATSAKGIRQLLAKNISVKFCDNLHSKIYWSKGNGLVVTSANLSDNALSDKGLYEFGVFIEDNQFDAKSILSEIGDVYDVNQNSMNELDNAERMRNTQRSLAKTKINHIVTFNEYYKQKFREKWKIVSYCNDFKKQQRGKIENQIEEDNGSKSFYNANEIEKRKNFTLGDVVLQVQTNEEECISKLSSSIKWLRVDFITQNYFTIVQRQKLTEDYFPFTIDRPFKAALKELFELDWSEIIDNELYIKDTALDFLNIKYSSLTTGEPDGAVIS